MTVWFPASKANPPVLSARTIGHSERGSWAESATRGASLPWPAVQERYRGWLKFVSLLELGTVIWNTKIRNELSSLSTDFHWLVTEKLPVRSTFGRFQTTAEFCQNLGKNQPQTGKALLPSQASSTNHCQRGHTWPSYQSCSNESVVDVAEGWANGSPPCFSFTSLQLPHRWGPAPTLCNTRALLYVPQSQGEAAARSAQGFVVLPPA